MYNRVEWVETFALAKLGGVFVPINYLLKPHEVPYIADDGLRFAIFYTKLHHRCLRPLLAADNPPAPPPLRNALRTIDIHITERIDQARLLPKAP